MPPFASTLVDAIPPKPSANVLALSAERLAARREAGPPRHGPSNCSAGDVDKQASRVEIAVCTEDLAAFDEECEGAGRKDARERAARAQRPHGEQAPEREVEQELDCDV